MRFFLDASVPSSAVYSVQGYARDLISLAAAEQPSVRLVVGQDVLEETRRNLAYNVPDKLPVFERFRTAVAFETVEWARRSVAGAARRFAVKDATIIAAARSAKVGALVTFDAKHLLNNPAVAIHVRAPVLRPQDSLELLNIIARWLTCPGRRFPSPCHQGAAVLLRQPRRPT
jgi:predicted nucleic acid-binding protein